MVCGGEDNIYEIFFFNLLFKTILLMLHNIKFLSFLFHEGKTVKKNLKKIFKDK